MPVLRGDRRGGKVENLRDLSALRQRIQRERRSVDYGRRERCGIARSLGRRGGGRRLRFAQSCRAPYKRAVPNDCVAPQTDCEAVGDENGLTPHDERTDGADATRAYDGDLAALLNALRAYAYDLEGGAAAAAAALAAPRLAGYTTSVRDLERLREIYRAANADYIKADKAVESYLPKINNFR